ncbi:MAG: hypothetical protein AAFU74_18250, partial [Bacteroidota bacterium]
MKNTFKVLLPFLLLSLTYSCDAIDDFIGGGEDDHPDNEVPTSVNFKYVSSLQVGGEESAEIAGYDAKTKRLFVVNVESENVSVFDISDVSASQY